MGLSAGCGKQQPAESAPKKKQRIEVGDSYSSVVEKLGKANINSVTENSRVLIYDKMEIKLSNDVVIAVYDHRAGM
jgi:hypothetical protein